MVNVLFVCTGNICRSPTAEGVFRHHVRTAGLADRFGQDSCGTHGYHIGDPPDSRAIDTAARRGYDLADLRARQLQADDFDRFDLLLGMDEGHIARMLKVAPANRQDRIQLLMDFATEAPRSDVPDPYYGGQGDFEDALDLIEVGVRSLLNTLTK